MTHIRFGLVSSSKVGWFRLVSQVTGINLTQVELIYQLC